MITSYPLHIPTGYARTTNPKTAFFANSIARARDGFMQQMMFLGASEIIISCNIQEELLFANQPQPEDAGVAVYFTFRKKRLTFFCDHWDRVEDNLLTIKKLIEALKDLQHWAVWGAMERALLAFESPKEDESDAGHGNAGTAPGKLHWWKILGVKHNATETKVKLAYRRLAKVHHPDKEGGNAEKFREITEAYDEAIKQFEN